VCDNILTVFVASEKDVERIKENIGEHDDDMLKITRTL
jgi:hypothetical protein